MGLRAAGAYLLLPATTGEYAMPSGSLPALSQRTITALPRSTSATTSAFAHAT